MRWTYTLLILALAACGDSATKPGGGVPDEAKKAADALTGGSDTSNNALCKLFTPAELEHYAGEPLKGPENAASGSGCQWPAKDDTGDVLIQIAPRAYHPNPKLADGYKALPEFGPEASVVPDMGGWIARAIVGEDSVNASVAGQGASADQAVALLREVLKRYKNQAPVELGHIQFLRRWSQCASLL